MKKILKSKYSGLILLSLFFILSGIYISRNKDLLDRITKIPLRYLCIIPFLHGTLIFNHGLSLKFILEKYSIRIKIRESFFITAVSAFANLMIPMKGGAALRALFLKKTYQFPYNRFSATIAIVYVIHMLSLSFLGVLDSIYLFLTDGVFHFGMGITFLVLLIFSILILFTPKPLFLLHLTKIFPRFLHSTFQSFEHFKTDRKVMLSLFLVTVTNVTISTLIINFCLKAISVEISFAKAFFISCIYQFSSLIAITPGAIGIAESMIIFAGYLMKTDIAFLMLASVINRFSASLVIFSCAPIGGYYLFGKHWNKLLEAKDDLT